MKKIILTLSVLVFSGCGFFGGDNGEDDLVVVRQGERSVVLNENARPERDFFEAPYNSLNDVPSYKKVRKGSAHLIGVLKVEDNSIYQSGEISTYGYGDNAAKYVAVVDRVEEEEPDADWRDWGANSLPEGYIEKTGSYLHGTEGYIETTGSYSHGVEGYIESTGSYSHGEEGYVEMFGVQNHDKQGYIEKTGSYYHSHYGYIEKTGSYSHGVEGYVDRVRPAAHFEEGYIEATGSNSHGEEGYVEVFGVQNHDKQGYIEKTNSYVRYEPGYVRGVGSYWHGEEGYIANVLSRQERMRHVMFLPDFLQLQQRLLLFLDPLDSSVLLASNSHPIHTQAVCRLGC